jgi:hypothetical protein
MNDEKLIEAADFNCQHGQLTNGRVCTDCGRIFPKHAASQARQEPPSPWVEIKTLDDLPKVDGWYDFTFQHRDGYSEIARRYVDAPFRKRLRPEYIAWAPLLEPYRPAPKEAQQP